MLVGGAAAGLVAVAGGFGLVEEGVLPGRQRLHRALGGCGSMAPVPDVEAGPVVSGTFTSAARGGAEVGWSIAYPPGSAEGDRLPRKSTSFAPKPATGMVLRSLAAG